MKGCCKAHTAKCLACVKGQSIKDLCKENPKVPGCEPRACCLAMISSCLACAERLSEREFCRHNPKIVGCDKFSFEVGGYYVSRILVYIILGFGVCFILLKNFLKY